MFYRIFKAFYKHHSFVRLIILCFVWFNEKKTRLLIISVKRTSKLNNSAICIFSKMQVKFSYFDVNLDNSLIIKNTTGQIDVFLKQIGIIPRILF
jgi:hypothetical protein